MFPAITPRVKQLRSCRLQCPGYSCRFGNSARDTEVPRSALASHNDRQWATAPVGVIYRSNPDFNQFLPRLPSPYTRSWRFTLSLSFSRRRFNISRNWIIKHGQPPPDDTFITAADEFSQCVPDQNARANCYLVILPSWIFNFPGIRDNELHGVRTDMEGESSRRKWKSLSSRLRTLRLSWRKNDRRLLYSSGVTF